MPVVTLRYTGETVAQEERPAPPKHEEQTALVNAIIARAETIERVPPGGKPESCALLQIILHGNVVYERRVPHVRSPQTSLALLMDGELKGEKKSEPQKNEPAAAK